MLDEKLSALIDDELNGDELISCLNQLSRDSEARDAWSRQHLLRAALKGQATDANVNLVDSVMAAIDQESSEVFPADSNTKVVPISTKKWRPNIWASGLALAASVAVVAVVSPVLFNSGENKVLTAGNTSLSTQKVAQRNRIKANDEARRELQQYLLDHEALASGHGLNSQRRYMRMASPGTTYVAYTPE